MFAIVPLLSTIIFVPQLLAGSSRALEPLLALLGIASLITTAYIMKYMPLRKTDSRFTQAALKPEAPTSILEYLLLANIIVSGLLTVSYVFLPRVESSLSHRQVTYVVPGGASLSLDPSMKTAYMHAKQNRGSSFCSHVSNRLCCPKVNGLCEHRRT